MEKSEKFILSGDPTNKLKDFTVLSIGKECTVITQWNSSVNESNTIILNNEELINLKNALNK
jgi:hypothetical protein